MAMAPEQVQRIGIKRHFTTPDVDPYDTLEWEVREARIPDLKSGGDAFYQPDVEFPTSWSQNATNIVAQKYFRGSLGSPEREHSVRQIIDRVADTIAEWGKTDGYFVDDDEAETFRAELKYVLVHQRAAFNSPVWFNIGVAGEPQQASACQPYHALVSTPEGMVPIGKLVEDDAVGAKVHDAHGVTQIVAVKHNGVKPVLRVHTKAGYTLDVTPDHVVWRATGEGCGCWVPAGELRPGDRLEWHRAEGWGAGEFSVREHREAALAGWLQSDGFVGQYDGTNRSLTIEAMTVTDAERGWVLDAIDKVFPDVHRHERAVETQDQTLDCRRIRLYGNALEEFVERWNLRPRGVDMTVPEHLFTAPLPIVGAYLRSVFQAEGYVSIRDRAAVVGLDMVSEELVRGLQRLLTRFGIYSRVRRKNDARPDRLGTWSLSIQPLPDRTRFAAEIGFIDPVKANKLERSLEMKGIAERPAKRLEIERIEQLGEMDVYDIQTESGEYLSSGNLRVHNCFILDVDDTMDSILNWYREEGIIFKGGSGSGVNLSKIRSSKEQLKGGGTASGPVSFMRGADASAGTIKSGGKTRRAAKMAILNVDHPDVEEFIWCKALEERKARALREAGFDMDLDGRDSHSIQYQNANNSVRVTDEFMEAVEADADWAFRAVINGEPVSTVKARTLMRQIAEAAWECADPGMQYDTTINRWHTAANTGRINASNPCCFVGDTLIATAEGPVSLEQLHKMSQVGEQLPDAWSFSVVDGRVRLSAIRAVWIAGRTPELVQVETRGGLRLVCTPEHRFLTVGGAYVEARELTAGIGLRAVSDVGTDRDDVVSAVTALSIEEPVPVYDLESVPTHNFVVTGSNSALDHGVVVHNSEYMHLDNSACNLASINLLKFLNDGKFDVEGFKHTVEVVFTAQEILVGNADYPTEKIGDNARAFRELGLGYANLGALLMARGLPYDSDEGRSWAAAITSLTTGHAYATSAKTAARMGPFAGYADNVEPMQRVLSQHRAACADIDEETVPAELLDAARKAWDDACDLGAQHGVRNSQASVLAPTGCLVGGTLVATERGLVRLGSLGNPVGPQWQDLGVEVMTDDGPREATQFYVNGVEPVVDVVTRRGHTLRGTTRHRIKVVDAETGEWVWRHFSDLRPGDHVPLALDQLVGEPQEVRLPPLEEAYWAGEHEATAPRVMTPELAELVGYFMGDGSLHAKGLRLCVSREDLDVVEHLERLGKRLFGLPARTSEKKGYIEVAFHSVRLVEWWEACGFAKHSPAEGHHGKGWVPHIPNAVLYSNDREVYAAFLRGLFEADGTVTSGYPNWSTTSEEFAIEVQALVLALGFPTSRHVETERTGWGSAPASIVRLLNQSYNARWLDDVGFIGSRKWHRVATGLGRQAARQDRIPVSRELIDRVAPDNGRDRKVALMELRRNGAISRRLATELDERSGDAELGRLLGFFFDEIASAELGQEELTFDLSVPENVTYVANGFVSHNTIGLMMDCDTTGVEPDLALTKHKKLVGGGTMEIVNRTIPRALRNLGYDDVQVDEIVASIDENKSIIGAPHVQAEHLPVFATAMGDNVIHYMGHVRMMAAVQPFISGAISKTINMPEDATVEEVEDLYLESWKLGLKAVAIYRDNCKVAQPLATQKKEVKVVESLEEAEAVAEEADTPLTIALQEPVRRKPPKTRNSKTFSFRVADCKGYVTVGEYEDGRPAEIFLKVAKQGSTMAGIMDAFAISVSHGLQYGVPLKAFVQMFTSMRFEPAGMTDDKEIRIASSLVDYIFRRLAVEYMPYDERAEMGVFTVSERTQPTLPGVEEAATPNQGMDHPELDLSGSGERAADGYEAVAPEPEAAPPAPEPPAPEPPAAERPTPARMVLDAPLCTGCGAQMRPSGSCYVCTGCGSTSGCS